MNDRGSYKKKSATIILASASTGENTETGVANAWWDLNDLVGGFNQAGTINVCYAGKVIPIKFAASELIAIIGMNEVFSTPLDGKLQVSVKLDSAGSGSLQVASTLRSDK